MLPRWEKIVPWYMTIISTAVLFLLAFYLVNNIEWFKRQAIEASSWNQVEFRLHVHHLHMSMIKRSVAIFSGVAALLIGLAVALYSASSTTDISGEGVGWSVKLATASPGIIAMLIGAILIGTTVVSKDSFPQYYQTSKQEFVAPESPLK